jgi:hypothetical protein
MKKLTFGIVTILCIGVMGLISGCNNGDAGGDAAPPVVDKSAKSAGAPPTVAQPGAAPAAPKTSYEGSGLSPELKERYRKMGAPIK